MGRTWFLGAIVFTAGVSSAPAQEIVPPRAALDKYCVTCHNQRLKTGGLALDVLDPAHVESDPAVWEAVVRKVRTRTMPPQGLPRPDDATAASLTLSLTTALDRAATRPNPGAVAAAQSRGARNVIRDLLALDVDVRSLLPPDDAAFGFDNNPSLVVSPSSPIGI
jgi:hypothetical protein